MENKNEKVILAGGCFWGVQKSLDDMSGVTKTTVGYTGGEVEVPTYKDVCTGKTGHAEAVLVEFDSEAISFKDLVGKFWQIHNPTTKDRQGPDVGSQYRSAIFYFNDEQKATALASKKEKEESGEIGGSIVTEIEPAGEFYPAEDYHQKYFEKNGGGACHF